MGYIKEPKGVDFIIESEPLTEEARREISEFIRDYKIKSKTNTKTRIVSEKREKKSMTDFSKFKA